MKAIIQRVKNASIIIENRSYSDIKSGLLVYIGINSNDSIKEINWILNKIINLRIFNDIYDKMNLSALETRSGIMVVPNFTIYANAIKGNRPSYTQAALPEKAESIYNQFLNEFNIQYPFQKGVGKFQSMMEVHSVNDGPINIVVETKSKNYV